LDDKAPLGIDTVNLPSADCTVPPDVPIDLLTSTPLGIPMSVMTGSVF
jgi:hypothetical protein